MLFYSIGVDTRRAKGERDAKDYLERDCQEREKQGRMEEFVAKVVQNRECWSETAYWRSENR